MKENETGGSRLGVLKIWRIDPHSPWMRHPCVRWWSLHHIPGRWSAHESATLRQKRVALVKLTTTSNLTAEAGGGGCSGCATSLLVLHPHPLPLPLRSSYHLLLLLNPNLDSSRLGPSSGSTFPRGPFFQGFSRSLLDKDKVVVKMTPSASDKLGEESDSRTLLAAAALTEDLSLNRNLAGSCRRPRETKRERERETKSGADWP